MVDLIKVEIELHGKDLTDQQRSRLMEIATKCPIHKTLSAPVKIEETLKK